jgi:hypothetical protein
MTTVLGAVLFFAALELYAYARARLEQMSWTTYVLLVLLAGLLIRGAMSLGFFAR